MTSSYRRKMQFMPLRVSVTMAITLFIASMINIACAPVFDHADVLSVLLGFPFGVFMHQVIWGLINRHKDKA